MNSNTSICGLLVAILTLTSFSASARPVNTAREQKAVLITGASTGIGRKITEVFAAKGYFVYAGARKKKTLML